MNGPFRISAARRNNVDTVALSGRLDTNTSSEAEAALGSLIASGSRNILVNLGDLDYISSSGLRVLLLMSQKLKKNQGELKLASPKPAIREIFHLAGFDRIFLLYDTEDEAFRSFGYPVPDEREQRIMDVVASTIEIEEDRRRTEENLRQSETLYQAIFENTGTAMVIIEDDMTIFLSNSEFRKMVGRTGPEIDEVLSILAFVVRDDLANVKEAHDRARQSREQHPQHCEFRLRHQDGTIRSIYMVLDLIPGTPRRVCSLHDITELRKLEEDLRYELTRRREFITVTAHELRTPLQPVVGYLHLVLEDPDFYSLSPDLRGILEKCRENIDREREMVEHIIRFSGLACSPEQILPQFMPQFQDVFPGRLLKSRLSLLDCPHNAEITVRIPEDYIARTDSEYFYLVILSLIFYLLRASEQKVSIEVAHEEGREHDNFPVRSREVVISPEILPQVFTPFYVGDESKLRKKFGFIGLSLPLAKKISVLLGGDIAVSSNRDTGTTFTLTLPKKR